MVRLRGDLLIWLGLATAPGDGFTGAFGIAKVTDDAFGVGASAVPLPIDDEGSDVWLYHRYFSLHGPVVSSTEANSPANVFRAEVDSKAMRKLTIDETIYAAVQVVETGTATAILTFNSRALFKLS